MLLFLLGLIVGFLIARLPFDRFAEAPHLVLLAAQNVGRSRAPRASDERPAAKYKRARA